MSCTGTLIFEFSLLQNWTPNSPQIDVCSNKNRHLLQGFVSFLPLQSRTISFCTYLTDSDGYL